ncbi:MAG: response regulator [Deltaproteobacteria bacterium]|nr:response regulator [Deltaproteobacteria bacterium]MBN2674556.1 response regulator [Deltaproteobacteria bacterium]
MAYNFLVVDDSAIIRSVVTKCLTMSGLDIGEIFEASNGRVALDVLDGAWVDMVFADLNMPEMDGREMIQEMADNKMLDNIPVVVIKSERNEEVLAWLTSLGVREYISKPFKPEKMKNVVERVLGA